MSQPLAEYRGIEGVTGREPVGAVLTIGKKGPKGNPVETDRFFLVVPTMGADGRRDPHPEFGKYNSAAPEHRQTIHAYLVHADEVDAWSWHLKAQVLPGYPAHPDKRPACIGDGRDATRYDPEGKLGKRTDSGFREIPCPNELCEFRLGEGAKPCKPWGRLYFRTRWRTDSLPETLTKWTTGSWNSVLNIVGFFEHVHKQAKSLGLEEYSLYGLPFVLTLSRKTKPSAKASFPIVSIAPDFPPGFDLISFFIQQKRQLQQLGGAPEVKLLPVGARDPEETDAAEVYADHATITPGHVRKPAVIQRELVPEEGEGELVDGPSLDERWQLLVRKADALGLSAARVHDAVNALGGDYPDMGPEMDAKIEEKLQTMARSKR